MLKVRVIPVLLLKRKRMVKPVRFGAGGERDVGWPTTTARIYNSQDADELMFLDIDATAESKEFLTATLSDVAKDCFVPITAGGGVRSLKTIQDILASGADKVSLNTYALERPSFITEAADRFGRQCIVVSIDARKTAKGYEVCAERGTKATGRDAAAWAREAANLGAGEILITSIDNEGTQSGYDLELTRRIADAVHVPVIANGGAGTRQHFVDGVRLGGASAVAGSSIFHFTDSNITQIKSFMYNAGLPIRPI